MNNCQQDSTEIKGNSFCCTNKKIYDTAYAKCDLPTAYGYSDCSTCMNSELEKTRIDYCIRN
jgi:hypothetical protein